MVNPFSSACELATAIRLRRVSASEVTEMYLARIATHNPKLNAVVTLDEAGARERAAQADAALGRGEVWGPLHGVPMTIKDALETAGMRTTGGHPPLAKYVPRRDATAVARLRAAGAVLMGKTNVPPLSADTTSIAGGFAPLFGLFAPGGQGASTAGSKNVTVEIPKSFLETIESQFPGVVGELIKK